MTQAGWIAELFAQANQAIEEQDARRAIDVLQVLSKQSVTIARAGRAWEGKVQGNQLVHFLHKLDPEHWIISFPNMQAAKAEPKFRRKQGLNPVITHIANEYEVSV